MELTKIQQEIREKLIEYADQLIAKDYQDYKLSNQDVGDIFGITRQAVYQTLIRQKAKKILKWQEK